MNAALRLISGEGELEKGWKRLFGIKRGLPSTSGAGVDSRPPGVRNSNGSFLTFCPCPPRDDTALLPIDLCVASSLPGNLDPFCWLVEIVLAPKATREEIIGLCEIREVFLRAFKHL